MTIEDFARRFQLVAFSDCELHEAPKAALITEFELGIVRLLTLPGTPATPSEVIEALNAQGHMLSGTEDAGLPGAVEFTELTNDGTRELVVRFIRGAHGFDAVTATYAPVTSSGADNLNEEDVATDDTSAWFAEEAVRLRERLTRVGEVSSDERMHLTLYTLESLVNNGGMASYLEHVGAHELGEAIAALRLLGATELLRTLERARELYLGGRTAPVDEVDWERLDTIRGELDALDEMFAHANDDLATMLHQRRQGEVTSVPDAEEAVASVVQWFDQEGRRLLERFANYRHAQGEERIHRVLYALDSRVRDGGFLEYVRSTSAPERKEAHTWLGTIGAFSLAAIVADALDLCPRKAPRQFGAAIEQKFAELDAKYREAQDDIARLVYELSNGGATS